MKFLKVLLTIIIIVGGLGYGVYHFGTNFISDKVADSVATELEEDDNVNEMKQVVNSNPEMKEFISEGAHISEKNLPFTTKEEAIKTVVETIGISELQKIQSKYQNGMSPNEVQELINELEGKLTEEEILALKAIAYKELNK